MSTIKLAIFLSGTGSNAKNICHYFDEHPQISVALLLSNNINSGAKEIAHEFNIPFVIFDKTESKGGKVLALLQSSDIDLIVLAGFLWLIPTTILEAFPNAVINIHPALLPKFGGKGMHGSYVHQAVYEHQEKESGITIHLCNAVYDEGKVLFQQKVALDASDQPNQIAQKVLALEHQYFPSVIENYCLTNFKEEI